MTANLGFCPKCGSAISEAGQQFCRKCGAALTAAAPAAQAAPAWTPPATPVPPPPAVPPGQPGMPPAGAPWAGYPGAPYGVPQKKGSLLPVILVLGLVGLLVVGGVIFAIVALKPSSSSSPAGRGGPNSTATAPGGSPSHAATATIPTSGGRGSITFDPDTFRCSDPSVTITWILPASVTDDTLLRWTLDGEAGAQIPGTPSQEGFARQADGRWFRVSNNDPTDICDSFEPEAVVGSHIIRALNNATMEVLAEGTFTIEAE